MIAGSIKIDASRRMGIQISLILQQSSKIILETHREIKKKEERERLKSGDVIKKNNPFFFLNLHSIICRVPPCVIFRRNQKSLKF